MPVKIEHAAVSAPPQGAICAGNSKKMYIKSYGCQMNVYDGLRMAELLGPLGYTLQNTPTGADLIILNTCHIREKADDKMFSDLGRFKKEAADQAILAVGGCSGQALGAKIYQQNPAVSIVFGPLTYHKLPKFIEDVENGRKKRQQGHKNAPIRVVDTELSDLEKFDFLPTPGSYGPSAFVTIQEGCDKFCTYCVVPYTRGAELSRPVQDIVNEVKNLAQTGTREVTLLGQNVNAYHGTDAAGREITLAGLLDILSQIQGIERLRFTTSHPNNTGDDLIAAFASNPKLMPYFHLPVQAGSNRILQAMNRNHTVESYLETVAKLRAARPDLALSGDFIVGFPGETEEDFEQTLAIVAAAKYASAYSFAYSPRPGTPAADMPNQIDEKLKKERLAALQAIIDYEQEQFNAQFAGQTVAVLVEEQGGKPGQMRGRSPHNISVNFAVSAAEHTPFPGRDLIGQVVNVYIEQTRPKSLIGRLIS